MAPKNTASKPGEAVLTFKVFTAREAVRLAKVPYGSLDYWARTKLVVPSVARAKGTGTERLYNFGDLVALRVVKALREAGVSTQKLRKAIKEIRDIKNPLTECRLLAVGSTIVWVESKERVTDVVRHPRQQIFPFTVGVVDYPRLVQEVVAAIAA